MEVTMAASMEWLKSWCNPQEAHRTDGISEQVYRIRYLDRVWLFATDCKAAVLVADPPRDLGFPFNGKQVERFDKVFKRDLAEVGVADLRALREWCGPAEQPRVTPCDRCGGDGRYVCSHCERDGDCPVCDGTGTVQSTAESRPGVLFDAYLDRNLLARLLEPFPAEPKPVRILRCKDVPTDEAAVIVAGDGWQVWLMPLCADSKEQVDKAPRLPVPAGSEEVGHV
jgi:hypothetical protein